MKGVITIVFFLVGFKCLADFRGDTSAKMEIAQLSQFKVGKSFKFQTHLELATSKLSPLVQSALVLSKEDFDELLGKSPTRFAEFPLEAYGYKKLGFIKGHPGFFNSFLDKGCLITRDSKDGSKEAVVKSGPSGNTWQLKLDNTAVNDFAGPRLYEKTWMRTIKFFLTNQNGENLKLSCRQICEKNPKADHAEEACSGNLVNKQTREILEALGVSVDKIPLAAPAAEPGQNSTPAARIAI